MEQVAVEQLQIDAENRRMVVLSNGGNPDSPNPTDRFGRPIEIPDRVVSADLFKPPLTPFEQATRIKLDMRQSITADPVGDARASKDSADPAATAIGKEWAAREAATSLANAWTGRGSRRAAR